MKMPTAPRLAALLLTFAALAGAAEAPSAEPGGSLQALGITLSTATGSDTGLAAFAGHPVVVTMFYSRCTFVCPAITLSLQRIEAALVPSDRERVRFVMVSLDDVNDSPAVLASFAEDHHLVSPRWTIAHASARDVRLLAAALGIRYRQLPDGSYSHSSVITVLDRNGVATARSSELSGTDPALLSALHAALE